MTSKMKNPKEGELSIILDIPRQQRKGRRNLTENWGSSFFQPDSESSDQTPSVRNRTGKNQDIDLAPEKELTLFALRLAVLEKTASGLGTLAFVWATVVLLGGFAVLLEMKDFWFVTIVLLIESTRVFSRSHELEWQHESIKSSAGRYSLQVVASSSSHFINSLAQSRTRSQGLHPISDDVQMVQQHDKKKEQAIQNTTNITRRTWHSTDVPLLPYAQWAFLSSKISRILSWLQLLSATTCVTLSFMRLIKQDFGDIKNSKTNGTSALNIFYALALAEALMFLLEKAYWQWRVSYGKLLEKVCLKCDLGIFGLVPITRFFYDAYSSCIKGSIFDGLKMDLVSFAMELLNSDSSDEQLTGARILEIFVKHNRFAGDTLRKIGTSISVTERLVDMLHWKNPSEEYIRRSAAEIVSKLAGKKQNALRLGGVPGAMESISSLLYTGEISHAKPDDEVFCERAIDADYDFSIFNLLGLKILKKLARDHDNCGKIGNARGLLSKIIYFTNTGHNLLRNDQAPESQIKAVRRSLQLVKTLVSATGHTGKTLRIDISENVFTVSNIREILKYGESHMVLQKLGIEILTSLAMDEDEREKIGSTGGVIKLLLFIFFKPGLTDDQNKVSVEAGEALAMLALESKRNCILTLKEGKVVDQLVDALDDQLLQLNSLRILRNLCAYSGTECCDRLKGVTVALPTVLKKIMDEKDKLQEVSVGLATQMFRLTSSKEYDAALSKAGIKDTQFAEKLVQILKMYNHPDIKVPRIRLFIIELAIQMMRVQKKYIQLFKNLAMEEVLEGVVETTSELENFNVFSGSVGLRRHKTTLFSLLDTAQELMTRI